MQSRSVSWTVTASLLIPLALLTACTAEPVQESPPPMAEVTEAPAPAEESNAPVAETEAAAVEPEAPAASPEAEAPDGTLSPEPAPAAVEKTWSVGIVSFQDEAKARQAADKLAAKGYAVETFLTTLADKHWYRVTVGGFKSKPDARAFRGEMRKQGYKTAWLVAPI